MADITSFKDRHARLKKIYKETMIIDRKEKRQCVHTAKPLQVYYSNLRHFVCVLVPEPHGHTWQSLFSFKRAIVHTNLPTPLPNYSKRCLHDKNKIKKKFKLKCVFSVKDI